LDTNILTRDELNDAFLAELLPEEGEIIGIPEDVWTDLAKAHRTVIATSMRRFGNENKRRKNKTRMMDWRSYKQLPDLAQDCNIYMRMHFSANPLGHPDPQVKTTAWMTVLTSLFALLSTWLYQGF
jgi:hypothetical protein